MSGATFNSQVDKTTTKRRPGAIGSKAVSVSDLNAAVTGVCGKGFASCNLLRHQDAHFTDAGRQFCAVKVAAAVAPLLAPKWLQLTPAPPPPCTGVETTIGSHVCGCEKDGGSLTCRCGVSRVQAARRSPPGPWSSRRSAFRPGRAGTSQLPAAHAAATQSKPSNRVRGVTVRGEGQLQPVC